MKTCYSAMVLIAIIVLFIIGSVAEEVDDFTIELMNDGTYMITNWSGKGQELSIPESINGISISALKEYTFEKNSTLEIVTIPNTVKEIGVGCFKNCSRLKQVILPELLENIPDDCFSGCQVLETVSIPLSVKTIGESAFCICESLRAVSFPSGLQSIGYLAFYACERLTEIKIPSSLTYLGESAFGMTSSVENIEVDQSNSYFKVADGVLFSKNGEKLILYPASCRDASYSIPEGVVEIGASAFCQARYLNNVSFPGSIEKLGNEAFAGCSLDSIEIPEGITSLPNSLFAGHISTIKLPDSLRSIGQHTFRKCEFSRIVLPSGLETIGSFAFDNCDQLKSIIIPEGIKELPEYTFYNCIQLETVFLPDSIKSMKTKTFYECHKLTVFVIEGSYSEKFCKDNGIRYISINDQTITIPRSVITIESDAFANSGCSEVILPDGLQIIENGAFSNNKMMIKINIPNSVDYIGETAFLNCPLLTITIENNEYAEEWCIKHSVAYHKL